MIGGVFYGALMGLVWWAATAWFGPVTGPMPLIAAIVSMVGYMNGWADRGKKAAA